MMDYVELVGQVSLVIVAKAPTSIELIRELGGREKANPGAWEILYRSDDHLASIIQRLRDADFAFAGGHGWPPAAVAVDLRDKGKVHGIIKTIIWTGPGQTRIYEQ